MHILIINFNLSDHISRDDFQKICEESVGVFTKLEGLQSKYWLANHEENTYGGVYFWKSREAMQNYLDSDFFKEVLTNNNPDLKNITAKTFENLEEFTNQNLNMCWTKPTHSTTWTPQGCCSAATVKTPWKLRLAGWQFPRYEINTRFDRRSRGSDGVCSHFDKFIPIK